MKWSERKLDFMDWYARMFPHKLLSPLALPLSWQTRTHYWVLHENARMIETAFAFVANNRVRGDYLEFGVFRGRTFIEAWLSAKRRGLADIRFFAFDSFVGLPEVRSIDDTGHFATREFSAARAEFERTLRLYRVDRSRISIVEGFYEASLSTEIPAPPRSAAIVFVDCDLYESTVPVLRYLTDLLVDGTVLIFDDWFCFSGRPDRGEQRAVGEWLALHPEISLAAYKDYSWAGKSFLVSRNAAGRGQIANSRSASP